MFSHIYYTCEQLGVSLIKLFEIGFKKKWGFQKVRYEIKLFEKAECLVKVVKK